MSRTETPPRRWRLAGRTLIALSLALLGASAATAQPSFSKAFVPATIGPGSVSTLTFTIDNSDSGTPVSDLAFTDNLPAGVILATPASPVSDCGGTLTAPDGAGTLSLSGGMVGAVGTCIIQVHVAGGTPGIYMNVSGDLTSSAGNSGTATADLSVATDRPGFTKSFSPSILPLGSRGTLTFTVDNTLNPSQAVNLTFTDDLPTGLEVADPAGVSNTCTAGIFTGGVVTAVPGTGVVSLGLGSGVDVGAVAAEGTCTVSVDVVATGVGTLENTSGELTSTTGGPTVSSGKAGAVLTSTAGDLVLIKEFTGDPVPPGGTVDLELTVANRSRDLPATDVAFTDDLGATLSGLAVAGPLPTDPCGPGSTLSGTTTLTLTGGTLPAAGSCTFGVTLQVPVGATPGVYPNTAGPVQGILGAAAEPTFGNEASDDLFVFAAPRLTKTFLDDPVAAGDSTRLEFTITNTSPTSSATDVTFTDELTTFLPFPVSATLPSDGFCGAGSSLLLISLGTERQGLLMTGGTLAPGASCTFEVLLDLPSTLPSGTYTNVSEEITATVDGMTVTGNPATASFDVVGGPVLNKVFTDDPVLPGGTVTLQLTLTHDQNAPGDATGITFTDDLDAALSGLVATGLPMSDLCGAGSLLSGTDTLTLTGGTLAPGSSCQMNVTLQVPPGATADTYTNSTSVVDATVSGFAVATPAAEDDLTVAGLTLAKEFTDDPVIPGGQATLQLTLTNAPGAPAASDVSFTDDLTQVAPGLTFDPGSIPATPCGVDSMINLSGGGTLLTFLGGSLGPGEMCQLSVTVNVAGSVASGIYANTTQDFSATIDGNTLFLQNGADNLTVAGDVLLFTKTFLTDPVAPGATVDLQFELTNLSLAGTATGITFTDDLDAALAGLQAVGLPMDGFCGAGSQLTGSSVLTLTGAELGPGASCTFTATVQVPAAPAASTAVNTTSSVTGTIGGLGVTGDPATDTLTIQNVAFTKTFGGPAVAGGTVVVTFTVEDLVGGGLDELGFTDDLDAVLPGLVATGLPLAGPCGAGSTLTGSGFLTLTGGDLGPGGSCSFDVTLQVPAGAAPGSYPNTTSELLSGGLSVADPATDTLEIEPPPTFAKAFAPDVIAAGATSTLTFTVDNTASAVAATGLDFTDPLPSTVVADPSDASTTCTGGTIGAVPGAGVITYTGGTVPAGSVCTVQVDVTSSTTGTHVNTSGDLTSSSGDSGPATDTLTVNPPPLFSKGFAPDTVALGEATTVTFTIDNTASTVDATGLDFTDVLPPGMTVADPANAVTDCTGGVLMADPGATSIVYTGGSVAAGALCTLSVDVVSQAFGERVNTTEELSSALGSSGTATGVLQVEGSVLEIPTLQEWGLLLLALALALVAARKLA